MDSVELLAPQHGNRFQTGTRISQHFAENYGMIVNPGVPKIRISAEYDLFFAFCQFPRDLIHLEYVEGWKNRCRKSVCWMTEIWSSEVALYKRYMEILSKFDIVILNLSQSVDAVSEAVGKRCHYSPLGIDSIAFCPYPNPPKRVIDVYSIGRRSEKTHRALLELASGNQLFYVYDSIDGDRVLDTDQHRFLFANMAKRSRYFIVNPGKIDTPGQTKHQSEIGNRFFEGIAAGTILIGEHPKNEEFKKIFHWPHALISLPFDSTDIGSVIMEMDRTPHIQQETRRNNVVESLLRHDWAYRWEKILEISGIQPMDGFFRRKELLGDMANKVINEL